MTKISIDGWLGRGRSKPIKFRLFSKRLIDGNCWRYKGKILSNGYGEIWYKGKARLLHRVSAHIFLAFDLDSKLNINHKKECRFKDCWNPEHLYPGTQEDNLKDAKELGHRTWKTPNRNRRWHNRLK